MCVHRGKITLVLVPGPLWLSSIVHLLCEKLAWLFITTKLCFENNLFQFRVMLVSLQPVEASDAAQTCLPARVWSLQGGFSCALSSSVPAECCWVNITPIFSIINLHYIHWIMFGNDFVSNGEWKGRY